MKKFMDGGEYFVLSILQIIQVPFVVDSNCKELNPAQIICEDAYYLSETGNGETAIELLRYASDLSGGEIKHFLIVRTHSNNESDCALRLEAFIKGITVSLHQKGYVINEISFDELKRIQSNKKKCQSWALSKREVTDTGIMGTYKSLPILRTVDWRSIYSILEGSGCSLAIHIIPTNLSENEKKYVIKNNLSCTQAAEGMTPTIRDVLANNAMERWQYYGERINDPFADMCIVVSGSAVNVALTIARIRQSMSDIRLDSMLLSGYHNITSYNLPWIILNRIKQNKLETFIKCSIEEAGVLLKLPIQDDFFLGIRENYFSFMPEISLLPKEVSALNPHCITIGTTVFSKQNIYISFDQLLLHTGIVGKPGVGKSTLLKQIIKQLSDSNISVLVMEPVKREYRDVDIKGCKVFTVERPVMPLLINPFVVPQGVALGEYRSSLLSAFKAAFSLPDPLPSLFEKAISESFIMHGWTDMSQSTDPNVTQFDMVDFIRVFKRIIKESSYSNEVKGNMMSGGAFRLQSLIERCPRTFDTIHSTNVEDLLDGCAVLEMGNLEPEQKALVAALSLISILAYLKSSRKSDSKLQNIILIDEVHALLDIGSGVTEEEKSLNNTLSQLLINIITEMRAYGVGVMFSDQSPSRVGGCILDNVDNLISFRLSGEEAELLRMHMGASSGLAKCLPLLEKGEAVLKNQYLKEPLAFRMSDEMLFNNGIHLNDQQVVLKQLKYLKEHADSYCPFKVCEGAGCTGCSVEIREEAHKYATQIYYERQDRLNTVEDIAAHIVKIPSVMNTRVIGISVEKRNKLCKCIAIHILRRCKLEKGIDISEDALRKLFNYNFGGECNE